MGGKEKNKKVLFNDDEEDDKEISKIKINKEFAQRYLHNKKREDLHRLEELKKKGAISSSSDSDSESKEALSSSADDSSDSDDYLNLVESSSTKQHQQFFDALLRVKKQDPILKQNKDIKLFHDEDKQQLKEESNKKNKKNKKDTKTLYLKDVLAKQLIEEGPEFNDEDISPTTKKTYIEEQEDLRKDFLNAAAADTQNDKDNEFFSLKNNKTNGTYNEDSDNMEFNDKLDEYFGKDDQLDDNSRFLKEFFLNKLWLDNKVANDASPFVEEDLSEDEREVERQEEYEYRFQENAGDRVLGHSRKIEGSVRNKKNPRKEQRERRHERVDMKEKARKEELKHLKNLKKQEMEEKLNKIIKTAGIREDDLIPLTIAEIEDEFDPEEYDKMMKKAFNDKYYDAEDANPEFCSDNDELKKPDFEKEDESLGLPNGWDDCEASGVFASVRERILEQMDDKHDDDDDDDDEDNVHQEEGKRKRKRKVALLEKAKEAMMDEYYKLDYEDTIGDLKTRFKYAKIKPNRYGMTPADILLLDDKELNQYVSLKKIAPYTEKEWKLSNQKRFELKTTVKNRLRDWKSVSDDKKAANKLRHNTSKSTPLTARETDNKSQSDEANGDIGSTSRKGIRKKHAVLTQLPLARLRAYGKIPSKSKVNKK